MWSRRERGSKEGMGEEGEGGCSDRKARLHGAGVGTRGL